MAPRRVQPLLSKAVRVLASGPGLGGIVLLLVSLAAEDPAQEWATGKLGPEAAMTEAMMNLEGFASIPIVRVIAFFLGLWLLGVAAHRIIKADDERANKEAADDARRMEQVESLIKEHMKVPELIVACHVRERKIRNLERLIQDAEEVLREYEEAVCGLKSEIETKWCNPGRSPAADAAKAADRAVRRAVSDSLVDFEWKFIAHDPQPLYNTSKARGDMLAFDSKTNPLFFEGHEQNIDEYRSVIKKLRHRIGQCRELLDEMGNEIERVTGGRIET